MSKTPMHECPDPNCKEPVPFHQLACRRHWYALPLELRSALTRARSMSGQGSDPHIKALMRCLEWYRHNG